VYAKIFRQIYEGTLCTKGPWQALVTFQQLLILSDRFGVVDMTAEAIARITTVPIEIINVGISALEQEDSGSRNNELSGRRITRLRDHTNWGWQITNYETFAKLRNAEERREYQREFKRKSRAKDKMSIDVNNVDSLSAKVDMSTPHTHTQIHKTLAHSPKNGEARATYQPDWFNDFWQAYPKRKSKGQAIKAWDRLKPSVELTTLMIRVIKSTRWPDSQFIQHPATWINARGWEDENKPKGDGFVHAY
jgi:hypothetical protein